MTPPTCRAGADVSDSAATAGQGEDQRGTGIRLHKTSVARLGAVIGLHLCVLERMSLGMSWDGRAALVVLFCSVNYTSLRRPRWVTVSCELDVLSRRPNMGASPQQITRFRTGSLRTTAALVETDRHNLFALVQAAESQFSKVSKK
jgi:hypothetical protein